MSSMFKKKSFHKNNNNFSAYSNGTNRKHDFQSEGSIKRSEKHCHKRNRNHNRHYISSDTSYDYSYKQKYSSDNNSSKSYDCSHNFEDKTRLTQNDMRNSKILYDKSKNNIRKRSHTPEHSQSKREAFSSKRKITVRDHSHMETFSQKSGKSKDYYKQSSKITELFEQSNVNNIKKLKRESSNEKPVYKTDNRRVVCADKYSNNSSTNKESCEKPISKLLEQSDSDYDVKPKKVKKKHKNRSRDSSKEKECKLKHKKNHDKVKTTKKKSKTSSKECNGNDVEILTDQTLESVNEQVKLKSLDSAKIEYIRSKCKCKNSEKCKKRKVCLSFVSELLESKNQQEADSKAKEQLSAVSKELAGSQEQCKLLQQQLKEQNEKHQEQLLKLKAEKDKEVQQLTKEVSSLKETVEKKQEALITSEVSNEKYAVSIRELMGVIEEKKMKEELLFAQLESEKKKHLLEMEQFAERMEKLKVTKDQLSKLRKIIKNNEKIRQVMLEEHPELFDPKDLEKIKQVVVPDEPQKPSDAVKALYAKCMNIHIMSIEGETVKGISFKTLFANELVNDIIINAYASMIQARANANQNLPQVYMMKTHFYTQLISKTCNFNKLLRWTKKAKIFEKDILFIPIHLLAEDHWALIVVYIKKKTILYYDSLGSANNTVLETILQYLAQEHQDKLQVKMEVDEWTLKNMQTESPQQHKSVDCGVFICQTIEFLSRGAPLDFSQTDMLMLRQRMILELFNMDIVGVKAEKPAVTKQPLSSELDSSVLE